MRNPVAANLRRAQEGVVLLETLIAILIFSLGVLAIVGLQAVMVKNTYDAKYRAEASYLAQQRIGAMWADPENLPANVEETDVSTVLPGGELVVTPLGAGQFTVRVNWQAPGESEHNFTATASITGG